MAVTRFFKKSSPIIPVILGNQTPITFASLDHTTGYRATQDEYEASEYERLMREQRYGISEITWSEYDTDYLQKKKLGIVPPKLWREEMSPSALRAALPAGVPVAAPVAANAGATVADVTPQTPGIPPAPEFAPAVGKRRQSKK